MTEPTSDADRRRARYLADLDAALSDLPDRVAADLRSGIAEELEGWDGAGLDARIAQFGDPLEIARAAGDATEPESAPAPPKAVAPAPAPTPLGASRRFAIVAALVLAFGGFLVPLAGWVVGVVLVLASRMWRGWEKAVAILLPFAALAVGFLVAIIGHAVGTSAGTAGAGEYEAPTPEIPGGYVVGLNGWHFGIILVFLLVPLCGGWLLWRLRDRSSPVVERAKRVETR
ncbi:hypothetical protein K8F61_08560 [Microbacterium resistens]|uniref:DUF1700 domain-containing protein n=1 Tax=Microbacterium resistens TaxID=156977 RepID=A0ABY3RYQ3_9MICO|nr:hypothetical protein [Microbacterium resistens]UGS28193.1 hypothetical protein K8F61_08560 [Microbacterium resistens]